MRKSVVIGVMVLAALLAAWFLRGIEITSTISVHEEDPLTTKALALLAEANSAYQAKDDGKAIRKVDELLNIVRAFPRREELRGEALYTRGLVADQQHDSEAALKYLRQALPLLVAHSRPAVVAQCQSSLAEVLITNGKQAEAVELVNQSKTAWDNGVASGSMHFELASQIVNNLLNLSRAEEALPMLDAMLAYYKPGSSKYIDTLTWLSYAKLLVGRYAESREYAERALSALEAAPPDTRTLGRVTMAHHRLAQNYFKVGDFGHAEPEYLKTIKLRSEEAAANNAHAINDALAAAYRDLAVTQWRIGKPLEAFQHAGRAIEISRTLYGPDSAESANAMLLQATIIADAGRYDEALSIYEAALKLYGKSVPQSQQVVAIHVAMGDALLKAGRLCDALRRYKTAASIAQAHFPVESVPYLMAQQRLEFDEMRSLKCPAS